jgi:hypothetical protein
MRKLFAGWAPVVKDFAPIIAAIILSATGWFTFSLTAAKERAQTDYQRREERYAALVSSSLGFHEGGTGEDKARFLNELNLCWLYCTDTVIRDAYQFLKSVETGTSSTLAETNFKTLMLDIRRDLLSRNTVTTTNLQPEEFRLFKVK